MTSEAMKRLIDELVLETSSANEQHLAQVFRTIDEEARRKGVSFYDMFGLYALEKIESSKAADLAEH